ncbi:hypothetical protein [Pseudonocardia sp. H11422]|uniref:hypothetical protein n=1 Tax=Pseudonocardia sp. H11422 TaxID=2835866 RepID=UPI001BDC367A|nr:hypothetical protein [Pseudonocardia sp. H11422]
MSYDAISAYTLVVGDEDEPATVSVHATADDAWRALDREVRARCGMRARPRRVVDADAAARLADAWRAAEPEFRFWNVTAHRLPILLPTIARRPVDAAR